MSKYPEQLVMFPKEIGWYITGKHDDGSNCYHLTSDCPEHGSCIDCDACKVLCECN